MRVIILSGPIASGKTTIGKLLADAFTREGAPTIFLDLDSEVEKLSPGFDWEQEDLKLHDLALARKIIAERTNSAVNLHHDVVVVGPFFTQDDMRNYTRYLSKGFEIYYFQLSAPLDVRHHRNVSRDKGDPKRDILEQQVMIEQLRHHMGTVIDARLHPVQVVEEIMKLVRKNIGLYHEKSHQNTP